MNDRRRASLRIFVVRCGLPNDLASGDGPSYSGPFSGSSSGVAYRRALGVYFLPITWEHFDLVLRQRDYFLPGPQVLFGFMRTAELRERAMELGGYDVDAIGAVRLVN